MSSMLENKINYDYKGYKIIFDYYKYGNKIIIKDNKGKEIKDSNTENIKYFDSVEDAEKYIDLLITNKNSKIEDINKIVDQKSILLKKIPKDSVEYYGYILYNSVHKTYKGKRDKNTGSSIIEDINNPDIVIYTALDNAKNTIKFSNNDEIKKVLIKNGKIKSVVSRYIRK